MHTSDPYSRRRRTRTAFWLYVQEGDGCLQLTLVLLFGCLVGWFCLFCLLVALFDYLICWRWKCSGVHYSFY